MPVNYFYEDYNEVKLEEGDTTNQETTDLNFSFLIKIFNKLTGNQKSKVLQILKNNSDLKETG